MNGLNSQDSNQINGSILKEKAYEISSQLKMQNFNRFKKRHNLSYKFE